MSLKRGISILLMLALVFFTALMLNISLPYFSLQNDVAFLRIKQWVIDNDGWRISFFVHAILSTLVLLAGFTQFSDYFLRRFTRAHRILGRVYVFVLLFLVGPSGLVMGFYANGGWLSQTAFVVLAILWLYTTAMAWIKIRLGDVQGHRNFMIRSYALTLSAVTLRLWKLGIVVTLRPNPMDVYMIVAWLGWVPNLLFAEWLIRRKAKRKKRAD